MASLLYLSPSFDSLKPSARRFTISSDDRGQLRLLTQVVDQSAEPLTVDELAEALRVLRLVVMAYRTCDEDPSA